MARVPTVTVDQLIEKDAQRARRRGTRVEQPQRSCGRVAGIRERGLTGCHAFFVDLVELRGVQDHLAPDRERARLRNLQGQRPDRAHVGCDVLPEGAVSAGRGPHGLGDPAHDGALAQPLSDTTLELGQVLVGVGVVE